MDHAHAQVCKGNPVFTRVEIAFRFEAENFLQDKSRIRYDTGQMAGLHKYSTDVRPFEARGLLAGTLDILCNVQPTGR